MLAISHGDSAIHTVQYLVAHGANLDARDHTGNSAFDYAQSTPAKPKIIEFLNSARKEKANQGSIH
jgi:ankyrin repeat protein